MTTGRINQVTNQTLPRHKKRPGAPVTLDSHPGASEHQAPVKHALIRGCCGAATRHDCQGTNNQPHTKLHTTKRNSTQTGTDNTTGRKSRCRQLRPPKNRYIEGVAEAMPPKRLVPQGLTNSKRLQTSKANTSLPEDTRNQRTNGTDIHCRPGALWVNKSLPSQPTEETQPPFIRYNNHYSPRQMQNDISQLRKSHYCKSAMHNQRSGGARLSDSDLHIKHS